MISHQTVNLNRPIRAEYPQYHNTPTLSFSQFSPQQAPPLNISQPLHQTQIIQGPPRIIQPNLSYRPLPQSILLPPQQTYQPQQSFTHPQYLIQPVPVIRRHPQYDLNPNFDYESANLLCQTKIVENTIFCVVCGSEYKISQKDQHVQKHIRKNQDRTINQTVLQKVQAYRKKQTKPTLIVKPIVLPEQIDVHFDPNVYQVIQQTIYEDQEQHTKKEAAIGQDGNTSFNVFDNNVSISHNNTINVNPPIDVQPNPFFSKQERYEEPQYYVPDFEIPNAQKNDEEYEPQFHENIEPVIVESQPMAAVNSNHTTPVPKVSHLLEESAVDKSNRSKSLPKYEEEPQISQPVIYYENKHAGEKLNSMPRYEEQPTIEQPIQSLPHNEVISHEQPQHQLYSQHPVLPQPQGNHHQQSFPITQQQPIIHPEPLHNIFHNQPSAFSKREPIYINLDEDIVQQRLTSSKIPKASRNLTQSQSVPNHLVSSHLPNELVNHPQSHQTVPILTNAHPFDGKNQEVHSQYSGPHEVRAPSVSNSKKSSINMSQFIRDHNDGTPMVFQDLKRIPNQSEW